MVVPIMNLVIAKKQNIGYSFYSHKKMLGTAYWKIIVSSNRLEKKTHNSYVSSMSHSILVILS